MGAPDGEPSDHVPPVEGKGWSLSPFSLIRERDGSPILRER